MGPHRILLTAGSNAKGQLGIGSFDDAHTFTPCRFAGCEHNRLPDLTVRVTHVACGANHTVLLLRHLDGSVKLWGTGDGRKGQLGPGYPREGPDPAPWTIFHELTLPAPLHSESWGARGHACKYIAAAWETTYVLLACSGSSDVLLSMGSNEFGALGIEEGPDAPTGHRWHVVDFEHVFPAESRRSVLTRTICVRALHASPRHVVAQLIRTSVDADGSAQTQTILAGWGASRHGQLGRNGGARYVARPIRLPIDIDDDPMVSCALGNQHTVVLHASGRISALGSNKQRQIPPPGLLRRIDKLGCTWNGTYMRSIDEDKHVLLSIGNNDQGQLGRGHTAGSVSAVDGTVCLPIDRAISNFACGSEHVLAAISSSSQQGNSVVGWGWNEHGNIGLGSLGNIAIPTQMWPRKEIEAYDKYPQKVIGIWAGCATSWLLVE